MRTIYSPMEKHNKKLHSFKREEQLYRLYIQPNVGFKDLHAITKTDLEKIKELVLQEGLSYRIIQYAIHVVRHAFNIAIQTNNFNGTNPAKLTKLPHKDNKRIRCLTQGEAQELLDELKKKSQDVYEIALLYLHSDMRFSEVANLTWQDIDFNSDLIHIKGPKSKENRITYMTEEVKTILLERQKHSTSLPR